MTVYALWTGLEYDREIKCLYETRELAERALLQAVLAGDQPERPVIEEMAVVQYVPQN